MWWNRRQAVTSSRWLATIAGGLILLAGLQAFVLRAAPKEDVAITAAIAYAKSNGMTENVMNHYNFGGQVIFNDIKSFIDGRADQLFLGGFTKKFAMGLKTRMNWPKRFSSMTSAGRCFRPWTTVSRCWTR